jgi:hypothetical protein
MDHRREAGYDELWSGFKEPEPPRVLFKRAWLDKDFSRMERILVEAGWQAGEFACVDLDDPGAERRDYNQKLLRQLGREGLWAMAGTALSMGAFPESGLFERAMLSRKKGASEAAGECAMALAQQGDFDTLFGVLEAEGLEFDEEPRRAFALCQAVLWGRVAAAIGIAKACDKAKASPRWAKSYGRLVAGSPAALEAARDYALELARGAPEDKKASRQRVAKALAAAVEAQASEAEKMVLAKIGAAALSARLALEAIREAAAKEARAEREREALREPLKPLAKAARSKKPKELPKRARG